MRHPTRFINANIFGSRAGVPGGQWPFGSDELRPYYIRAAEILKKREGVREQWRPQAEAGLVPMERYAGSTVAENRLGPAYRQELEEARLQVLLHGSVTGLNFAPSPTRVGSVTVQTLAGNFFFVAGRVFVLATGAVENARLLLLPAPSHARGIGNGSDHVGRYFADHRCRKPLRCGQLRVSQRWLPTAHVFGDEIGTRVISSRTSWRDTPRGTHCVHAPHLKRTPVFLGTDSSPGGEKSFVN